MRVLLDTSVLVPALVPALPQHEKAAPHLESALREETGLILSAHALAECYASLTALPISPQVTPGQARRLIEENVARAAEEIVELGPTDYLSALRRMTDLGLESGAVYDALHVACAEKASAEELRTFNGRDFRPMPPEGPTELVVL
ncbi:MAG: VapC toxin family PIN domain ribonuclease [Bacteroidetes bacterium QH_6_63_17]|jgi:predicted nucleic acid-binding protein|nr:MAG: VapC toxin family PIN domain ribonuclease [Bacteroidetes bacterium QH_6_63_17]